LYPIKPGVDGISGITANSTKAPLPARAIGSRFSPLRLAENVPLQRPWKLSRESGCEDSYLPEDEPKVSFSTSKRTVFLSCGSLVMLIKSLKNDVSSFVTY
jgi:hypothetical protein